VKSQKFEEAASLRDTEKKLQEELEKAKSDWEEESKHKRYPIEEEDIAEVVSMMTGIPVKRMVQAETEKLRRMADDLQGAVIGQDEAIAKVVKAIQRNRIGLKDPKKPIGTFIFLGPTGVGKTQLAKELAKIMFGDQDAIIRVDMSEFSEKFDVTKLTGAPPGYVGHQDGGQLTEKVRRKPYSIVLFDEVEKAHPEIFNSLLQILDEGSITDGLGRKINFKNTLIILTSNVGQRKLQDFGGGVGFATKASTERIEMENEVMLKKELQKMFSPEFINRLDDIVYFKNLEKDDVMKILEVELTKVIPRLESLGYRVKISQDLKEKITEAGFDPKYGARPIKRIVQKYIEDTLADLMITSKIEDGSTVSLSYDEEKDKNLQTPVKSKITKKRGIK